MLRFPHDVCLCVSMGKYKLFCNNTSANECNVISLCLLCKETETTVKR